MHESDPWNRRTGRTDDCLVSAPWCLVYGEPCCLHGSKAVYSETRKAIGYPSIDAPRAGSLGLMEIYKRARSLSEIDFQVFCAR